MSRAETAERLVEAAIGLGVADGVGALGLQGIATRAGVSKALILYHFGDKPTLLSAVVSRVGTRSAERMNGAARAADALMGWRALARAETANGELALLAGLAHETDVAASPALPAVRAAREESATQLGAAILRAVGLAPRVPVSFLGRVLVRHLDGLVIASSRGAIAGEEFEAELDTFALALLGLGR